MVSAPQPEIGITVLRIAGRARGILITQWTWSAQPVGGSSAIAVLVAVAGERESEGVRLKFRRVGTGEMANASYDTTLQSLWPNTAFERDCAKTRSPSI